MASGIGPIDKYYGIKADGYDRLREPTPNWQTEQRAGNDFISSLPVSAKVLDVPVGTGRFFSAYKARDIRVCGVDASRDMLQKAQERASELQTDASLVEGNILSLPLPDNKFDAVLSFRLLGHLPPSHVGAALTEISRVTRRWAMVTIGDHYSFWSAMLRLRPPSWPAIATKRANKWRQGIRPLDRGSVIELIQGCGFRVCREFLVGFGPEKRNAIWLLELDP